MVTDRLPWRRVSDRLDDFESWLAARLTVRQATAFPVVMMAFALVPTTVAAQTLEEASGAVCGTSLPELIGYGFLFAAVFFLLKGGFKLMDALDKSNSTNQKTAHEGKEKMSDAGTTMLAAAVPSILAIIFELAGIQTISCLNPGNWSILSTAVLTLF